MSRTKDMPPTSPTTTAITKRLRCQAGRARAITACVVSMKANAPAAASRVVSVGCSRNDPDAVLADRAYSSGVTRRMLRARGITAVIPQKRDELAARARRGRASGRPPHLDQQI
jgi:hypothetical protein